MPPSPAVRGPRFESEKQKDDDDDDDLALFNHLQTDNLLLNHDDIIFNYKLGVTIPTRGETSDLLNAEEEEEEEKNDYEWLLTPPDTPLFPSLDDELPQVNPAQSSRPPTQPISISTSSTMEKSHRRSRGSASPNRVSISPQSHNSPFESRGRHATSAPSASPPATSSVRSSPPSRKPTTPVPQVSTLTPRRLSTSSNGTTGSRGSRGNSSSPKVKAWQSTIPGFSTEVPPNLRTSLADRPASYVRGSSPASRSSRQSMSPTASKSISSSHSKGSVGSSADDDLESFSSVVGATQRLNSKRVGGFQVNNNSSKMPHQQFSRKPSRTVSSSSAPKRSFDSALRQMDHRKGPQNMFRPLLSSVPSSSFHGGLSSSPNRTMFSRNSSVTASNASSGLGLSDAYEPETSLDDATSGPIKVQDRDVFDEEVFMLEKDDDALNESHDPATLTTGLTYDGNLGLDSQTGLSVCSKCGCQYSPIGIQNDTNLCGECIEVYSPSTIVVPVTKSATTDGPQMGVVEDKAGSSKHDNLVRDDQSTHGEPSWNLLSDSSLSRSLSEECEPKQANPDMAEFSKSKVDSLEGAGISLLLKRSNSVKGTVVRNMNFSASSISYDDFSYVRDSTNNSMRSVSLSSSVDFGVNKQTDTRFQRQLSSTKSEVETYKFDLNTKHHRSGSSLSGTSSHAFHPSSLGTSTLDSFEKNVQANNVVNDTFTPENNNENQTHLDSGEPSLNDSSKIEVAEFQEAKDLEPDDSHALQTCNLEKDSTEVQLDKISEGENDQTDRFSPALKHDVSLSSTSSIEVSQEDVAVSVEDHDSCNHTSNIIEESIVLVEHEGGPKGRSLTLEEAMDAILFCSSIVHDLAHRAATIAIDKEKRLDDKNVSWPLIPASRKSDLYKPKAETQKKTSKGSSKTQQRKEGPDSTETHQPKTLGIVGVGDSNKGEIKKPPMLESKCNCRIM
ncbi:hypothetical protein QVD17_21277 [Tagetes erecta]|uniref:Uncharacterized protein n=1 Tax=Tagetes erecta TaxID=13708 RepID=A0AAD8NYU3_TARER|nr:hypothetical protein QVD17_21277 [Tagetes erecta]